MAPSCTGLVDRKTFRTNCPLTSWLKPIGLEDGGSPIEDVTTPPPKSPFHGTALVLLDSVLRIPHIRSSHQ
ncbi:hypothetical protein TNCV_3232311 [Trichonephila clavipes]|nr:hypothetical protein TNCV_3232311 [Trichonephila clavipes]